MNSTYQLLKTLREYYYQYFTCSDNTMKQIAEMAVHNILNDFVKAIERERFTGDELIATARGWGIIN